MKRDMDLVRKILLAYEASEDCIFGQAIPIDGYDDVTVSYHRLLICQADLADGTNGQSLSGQNTGCTIVRLTWKGHEFIEAARNETLWVKAKKHIKDKAGEMTVDALFAALGWAARNAIGDLPSTEP